MAKFKLSCTLGMVLAACTPALAQFPFSGPAVLPVADCDSNGAVGPAFGGDGSYWSVSKGQINFSGATLFADYFETGQFTNDWIDADGDCFYGYNPDGPPFADQLAAEGFWGNPSRLPFTVGQSSPWMFQFRSVGSINGFIEFQSSQLCGQVPNTVPSETGLLNRFRWAVGGQRTYDGPHANCSGTPFTPCEICGSFADVPSTWATRKVGNGGECELSGDPCLTSADCPAGEECVGGAAWFRKPCEANYGSSPQTSSTGYPQTLPPLQAECAEKVCAQAECFVGQCDDEGAASCATSADCAPGVVCLNVSAQGACLCEDDCSEGECVPVRRCSDNPKIACTSDADCVGTCEEVIGSLNPCNNFEDCAFAGEICADTDASHTAYFNVNYENPDEFTIYDSTVGWLPIAIISNRGTGRENIRFSEAQYLFTTGRMPNGENLVGATRDAGSGTRNGAMNSLGIDPSWGRGDHLGGFVDSLQSDLLGPRHQPTNKGGSSRMEGAVQNNRLAIGYTGLAGASRAAQDAAAGSYEILNVCKDIGDSPCDCCEPNACPSDTHETEPGIQDSYPAPNEGYVRPDVRPLDNPLRNTILDNEDPCCGYQIAGSGSFTTRGNTDGNRNPNSYCTVDGVVPCPPTQICETDGDCEDGESCVPADPFYNPDVPAVENDTCAQFLNNIKDSIRDFSEPGTTCQLSGEACTSDADCQDFPDDFCQLGFLMPGQKLALDFFLPGGEDTVHDFCDPISYSEPAGGTNQFLQNYIRLNNTLGWADGHTPAFPSSAGPGGRLPVRLSVACTERYSDGQQASYCNSPGNALPVRYAVHGDFNQNGAREVGDAARLVQAWRAPRAYFAANNIVPEIFGDFNGDGSLTKEDLRYWADGLAMVSATPACAGEQGWRLDRMAGAIAIDDAMDALGVPFPWADQRRSIVIPPACNTCQEPTFDAPEAIENIFPTRNAMATPNAYDAGDFRADVAAAGAMPIPGGPPQADGRINDVDIDYCCKMVNYNWSNPAEAPFINLSCDVNGDLAVDSSDLDMMIEEILDTTRGDADLDGLVSSDDLDIVNQTIFDDPTGCNAAGTCGWADGDFTCDGHVEAADRAFVVTPGDCDFDGDVDVDDYNNCFAPCLAGPGVDVNESCVNSDLDIDGDVDLADFDLFTQGF
jgi:hypothetical protein